MSDRSARLKAVATTRAERWALRGVYSKRAENVLVASASIAASVMLGAAVYSRDAFVIGLASLYGAGVLLYLWQVILVRIIERQARELEALRGGTSP